MNRQITWSRTLEQVGRYGFVALIVLFTGTKAFAEVEKREPLVKVGIARLTGDDDDANAQKQLAASLQPDTKSVLKGMLGINALTQSIAGETPDAQEASVGEIGKKEKVSLIVWGTVEKEEIRPVVSWIPAWEVLSQRDHPFSRLPEKIVLPAQPIKKPSSLIRLVQALTFLEAGDSGKAVQEFDSFLETVTTNKGDVTSQVAWADYKSFAHTNNALFLQKMVDTLQKALRAYQEEKNGVRQADIQNDLGLALRTLASVDIDPEKNLRLAVMSTLEAAHLRKSQGNEAGYTTSQKGLGQTYMDLATRGVEPEQNLKLAIQTLKEVSESVKKLNTHSDYLDLQVSLGVSYRELARWGIDYANNLKSSETILTDAALFASEKKEGGSKIQNHLGLTYQAFAQWGIEPKQNLEKSLTAFKEVENLEKKQKNNEGYALIQNQIGSSYQALAQWGVEPKQNLLQAIAAFEDSARIQKERADDVGYAKNAVNLGTSYRTLAQQGEDPERYLNKAVAVFQDAAEINKKRNNEAGYAALQNELGVTYKELANRGIDPEKNVLHAIDFHQEAAKVWKNQKNGMSGYVMAQNHLGLNYQALADRGIDPEENQKRASEALEESRKPTVKLPR